MRSAPGLATPDPALRADVAALVERSGKTDASRKLEIDRDTVARIARGEPVRRGSLALARLGVERLNGARAA